MVVVLLLKTAVDNERTLGAELNDCATDDLWDRHKRQESTFLLLSQVPTSGRQVGRTSQTVGLIDLQR